MTEPNASNSSVNANDSIPFWSSAITFGLLGPVAAFAKMGTVPLLIICLFGYASFHRLWTELKHILRKPSFLAFGALMFWCLTSSIWSDSPAWLSLLRLFLMGTMAILAFAVAEELDSEKKQKLSIIVLGSSTFLLIVLMIEGLSDAALHQLFRPDDVAPRDGEWVPYLLMVAARGTAILAPLCFVAAAVLMRAFNRAFLAVLFVAFSFLSTVLLPMDASSLAIACGCFGVMLARWKPRLMTRFLFGGILVVAFVSPFLTSSLVTRDVLTQAGFEPTRALSQRLEIWEYSSKLALERPILGHGFDSSRFLGSLGETVPGTNWPALPLHPHNAFLQIWLELGLVGICLVSILLGTIWRYFECELDQNHDISFAIACFVAVMTLSLISFGVWQYWWIATWALLALVLRMTGPDHIGQTTEPTTQ